MFKNKLPSMDDLWKGYIVAPTMPKKSLHEQLVKARLSSKIKLQLRADFVEAEDIGDLQAIREMPHKASDKLMCPACEDLDDDDVCGLCGGKGIVTRKIWNNWYDEYVAREECDEDCDNCDRGLCVQDNSPQEFMLPLLELFVERRGEWLLKGNHEKGFKLGVRFCQDPHALDRFLNAVLAWNNLLDDDDDDDED